MPSPRNSQLILSLLVVCLHMTSWVTTRSMRTSNGDQHARVEETQPTYLTMDFTYYAYVDTLMMLPRFGGGVPEPDDGDSDESIVATGVDPTVIIWNLESRISNLESGKSAILIQIWEIWDLGNQRKRIDLSATLQQHDRSRYNLNPK
ncbi:hypothetical protein VMCG_10910 [Cytospora schulzeri]|uniref:Uncharacterized protein n=1 Tax=Cytospora schulzeri TaxID=448051 RepID=A0A423V7V6_9PEZI|nr:hypothetical protein VMCG_10910 [Valsa malicola]